MQNTRCFQLEPPARTTVTGKVVGFRRWLSELRQRLFITQYEASLALSSACLFLKQAVVKESRHSRLGPTSAAFFLVTDIRDAREWTESLLRNDRFSAQHPRSIVW